MLPNPHPTPAQQRTLAPWFAGSTAAAQSVIGFARPFFVRIRMTRGGRLPHSQPVGAIQAALRGPTLAARPVAKPLPRWQAAPEIQPLLRVNSLIQQAQWVCSYKFTSRPQCTKQHNPAQERLVRLRRKHSAFSRELGPLRPASSVPGVVSAFIGVHRRPIMVFFESANPLPPQPR